MSTPIASLSLDLDNQWSYMKTHGDAGWEAFPSYLDVVVPRFLSFLRERELTITVFVVGQDAALSKNSSSLAAIAQAGHEIGNHSFHHEPWLHLYNNQQLSDEIGNAETALQRISGSKPIGFRGPGFSFSTGLLTTLINADYEYDASTFPTFIGPLARMYYFFKSSLKRTEKAQRQRLFGTVAEGLRSIRPYRWVAGERRLLEIPVTTMPATRVPIHLSYLLYLRQFSRTVALTYWRSALAMCRANGVEPSLLLHPLDFLGRDDNVGLDFFPAMQLASADKLALVSDVLALLARSYRVVPMREHAHQLATRRLPVRTLPADSLPLAADEAAAVPNDPLEVTS
jgi:peptidoglycan/xylan/chitin deacetylase (PgdA/CDA1 family)